MRLQSQTISILFFTTLLIFLSGCAGLEERSRAKNKHATNEVRIAATPKAEAHKTITNFSESLRCMDTLFARYRIKGLVVGAQDIPDATEVVLAGTKDMLISTLSAMSIKSRAISFVALGQDLEDITRFHTLHRNKDFKSPDFFIRGAITQVDRGVLENQISGGIGIDDFGVSASADRISSIIALDMNMGLVSNLQILPGINTSNSIAVIRRGKGADLSGTIKNIGAVFQVNFTESEGLHHALRTLVELGAIEIMGKLTQVPYWECLDIETTSTYAQTQIEDWYKSLSKEDRVKFIQAKLSALKLYDGPVDGYESQKLKTVVALYKSKNGIIADSKANYMLYYKLITDPTPVRPEHEHLLTRVVSKYLPGHTKGPHTIATNTQTGRKVEEEVRQETKLEPTRVTPLDLSLTSSKGRQAIYQAGDDAQVVAKVTTDSYLYCYYQPSPGEIIKIFPNRYTPESRVQAGETINIPSDQRFSITMEPTGNKERVLCMAAYENLEKKMPYELKGKSLQPVSLKTLTKLYKRKVTNLTDVFNIYKSSARVIPISQQITLQVQQ